MTVSREPSLPHDLDLVIDFVNTRDLERVADQLSTPDALSQWLHERRLLGAGARLGASELGQAIELREALRTVLHQHNDSTAASVMSPLQEIADRGSLSVAFHDDGTVALAPRAGGFAGALAWLLVPVAEAARDGTWERVKACAADDCQWAFYDRSRNHSGRWCNMAVCGNRTKVRAYRSKRQG